MVKQKMQIKRIGKFYNIRINLEGFNNIIWKYTTYPSERCTSHVERDLHNLIWKPFYNLIWKIRLFINLKSKHPKEQCEGCGEGFAKWMIDEPNGEGYSIVVCNDCVGFYDFRHSRKLINIYDAVTMEKANFEGDVE